MVDDHRAAGQGQGIRQHDGAALGCGDGLVVGGGVGQPGGLAAALAVPHLDVAVVHGNGAAAGGHEQPVPQLLAGAVGVQRPDGVAVLLSPAHVFLGGQFHRLVLGVGHGQGQVAGQAAAGQLQGMVAALGIIGDRDIPHVAAGGAAEPDGAQVGLQARLTIQNTGEIQRHHAALGGAVAAQGHSRGHRHGVPGSVGVPALGVGGGLVLLVVGFYNNLVVAVGGVGIGVAGGGIAGPGRAVGRGDGHFGAGDPIRQHQLGRGIGKGAQLLHGQVGGALVVLAYFVAQHGDGPIPPVGGEGGVPEGNSLLREVFFAGAAVEKRGGAA